MKWFLKLNYTYDSNGRILSETSSSFSDSKKVTSTTDYGTISSDWTQSLTETDSLGFATVSRYSAFYDILLRTTEDDTSYVEYVYTTDTTNVYEVKTLKVSERDKNSANNNELSYTLFTYYLSSETFTDSSSGAIYTLTGLLKSVETKNGTKYSYTYDKWGNVLQIKVGSGSTATSIVTNSYNSIDGSLSIKQLASGRGERYYYDSFGRLTRLQVRATSTSAFANAYEWFYTVDGRLIKTIDYSNNKIYEYMYDASGRTILIANGERSSGKYSTFFEYEYDDYGDIQRESTIIKNSLPLSGSGAFNGMVAYNIISTTGTYSRIRDGKYEYIYINGIEQIKYTYSSTDVKTSYIVREDNKLNNNPSFPNGCTITYTRDAFGKMRGFNFCSYGSTTALLIRGSYYEIRSETYKYDNGSTDVWDINYAVSAAVSGTPTVCDTETYNNTTITGVLRAESAMYNGKSLVNPKYLQNALPSYLYKENKLVLRYMIRFEQTQTVQVGGLSFGYSDGTYDTSPEVYLDNSKGTAWQEMFLVSNDSKTVTKVVFLSGNSRLVRLGNVQVEAANNAWDTDYILNYQLRPETDPVQRVADSSYNSNTPITNILRINAASYCLGSIGGEYRYQSLVAPDLLLNNGDSSIVVDFWIRRETTASNQVYNLAFNYTDGTFSASTVYLPQDTQWHHYSMSSYVTSIVKGIVLRVGQIEWIQLGNVHLYTRGQEKKDSRISEIR